MSEELVHVANNAVALPPSFVEVDETGLSDNVRLKPANIIMCQNTTRETFGAHPGQFLDSLNHKIYDDITVVPLKMSKTRVMFPPGADLDAEPLCRSNDGIVPSPFAAVPQNSRCNGCPQSVWVDNKKPPCAEKLKFLVIIKDSGIPRFFTVGGKSIPVVRDTMQAIKEDIQMNQYKGTVLKLYDYYFTIKSQKVPGARGSYYIARFDDVKRVANVGDFGPLFTEFVLQAKFRHDDEEAQAAIAQTDEAVGKVFNADYVPQQV